MESFLRLIFIFVMLETLIHIPDHGYDVEICDSITRIKIISPISFFVHDYTKI